MHYDLESTYIAFEKFILDFDPQIGGFHPYFKKAFWEMVANGGKRFRPKLLFSVVGAYEPLLLESAFYPALALECLHTYSLIHDDLPAMDDANTRRGHPTLHKAYDEVTAILAGDALNTFAFYLLSCAPLDSEVRIDLVKELATSGGVDGMIIGQALDCKFEKTPISLEQLQFLHIHKTGKLIASSLKMGAILCDTDKNTQERLYALGIELGLLFQIVDDLIDVTKSAQEAGKDTNNDANKNSYVNLLGIEGARAEAKKQREKTLALLSDFDTNLQTNLSPLIQKYLG